MTQIYWYNFIFLTFFLLVCEQGIIPKKWYKNICIAYFVFIFGQRWSAGIDFYGYLKYYIISFPSEIGYRTIERFFSRNDIYFGNLIFIIYTFTLVMSIWFINYFYRSNYLLYIFFLSEYHIMMLNPLRTYIAISFFLIVLIKVYEKNKKLSLLFIFLGGLFHKLIFLASIFILVFLNQKIIFRNKKKILLGLIVLPLLPTRNLLILFAEYFNYGRTYLGSSYDIQFSILNTIRYYLILILYFIFSNKKWYIERKNNFINIGIIIFIFIMGISCQIAPLHRVAYFFKIFEVLFFFKVFISSQKNKYLKQGIIIFIFIINYIVIAYKDMGVLSNYELRFLQLKNTKTFSQYLEEVVASSEKFSKYSIKRKRN